jgi:hypothetical protein
MNIFGTCNKTETNDPMILCIWHFAVVWNTGTNISDEYSAYIFKDEAEVTSLKWWYPCTRIHHGVLTQKTTT